MMDQDARYGADTVVSGSCCFRPVPRNMARGSIYELQVEPVRDAFEEFVHKRALIGLEPRSWIRELVFQQYRARP